MIYIILINVVVSLVLFNSKSSVRFNISLIYMFAILSLTLKYNEVVIGEVFEIILSLIFMIFFILIYRSGYGKNEINMKEKK